MGTPLGAHATLGALAFYLSQRASSRARCSGQQPRSSPFAWRSVPVLVSPRLTPYNPVRPPPPAVTIRGSATATDAAPPAVGMRAKWCEGPRSLT